MNPPRSVAVIGGGWAGCAAAATLAAAGVRVALYEAASDLGGRARRVQLELAGQMHALDNGQHLMIGAYTAVADLLHTTGVHLDAVIERRPFELRYPDGFRLQASTLPAPWHLATALLGARGLPFKDRVKMTEFLRRLKSDGWRVGPDRAADGWLADHGQAELPTARIWRPLGLAALNTPLAGASAQLFANVLRDSLGASREASMLWLPRANLSALLPDAVERFVVAHGGAVHRGTRIEALAQEGARFRLGLPAEAATFADAVIYAAAPAQLARMAPTLANSLDDVLDLVSRFEFEPICTVYLKYAEDTRIPRGFAALLDRPAQRRYGQWVFDRGALDSANRGVLAVIISASGPHEDEPLAALCEAVGQQLSQELRLPTPRAARAIVEKRATLAARPCLQRPRNTTAVPGLALAGDWTDSDYPSTLEGAVRSGIAAARQLLQ